MSVLTVNYSALREIAHRYCEDIPAEEYIASVDSLTLEFDAAIIDRWSEWQKARKEGWPLDRPLVERIGR